MKESSSEKERERQETCSRTAGQHLQTLSRRENMNFRELTAVGWFSPATFCCMGVGRT